MDYPINFLLLVPVLMRCYIIYRFFICLSPYYDERTDRITKMFGGVLSRVFAIKTFLYLYPIQSVFFFSLTVTIIFSYIIRIFENCDKIMSDGTLLFVSPFGSIADSFWYLWVTYATGKPYYVMLSWLR
jgi:hypothetical protein